MSENLNFFFWKGRKHYWKRKKCWLPALSPFPQCFHGMFVWCLMPFSTVFQLYTCFPGVPLTSTPHNNLSKPLAASHIMPPQQFLFLFEHCDLDIWPWPVQMTLTLVPEKGLTSRKTYVKYESSITYYSKVLANVNQKYWPMLTYFWNKTVIMALESLTWASVILRFDLVT